MTEREGSRVPGVMGRFNPGDTIAKRYRVQRMLGRGGMGEVYLVQDRRTGQRLALKTLLTQYAQHNRAVQRFAREVNVVRQLNHPCIIKVYDAGRIDALLYYTMDYVEGKSLRAWLQQRGRLGVGSTVRILSLLCHALEHAHQFTIHRDLSPDNIMILRDGAIKLVDFGLAKVLNDETAFTRIGVRLGKMQYSAPEQNRSAAEVDRRADIYSVGVMFFELLTGQFPKPGQRLTELVPVLPPECDAFVEKTMARAPEDRFADAKETRAALAQVYRAYVGKQKPPEAEPPPRPRLRSRIRQRLAAFWRRIIPRSRKRRAQQ
ncbi:MAG TPA: serine/threonine protein kinase [Candidatus Hydrogenedentes bacterium]|nr:serine/threonine protein kinase [Candidatus Hydrogenedentota bacterium]HIJ74979.1 serine/threonine protein kinase [Candidatus Hydrogenedentota bacterium]